jgi:hypothetical protein
LAGYLEPNTELTTYYVRGKRKKMPLFAPTLPHSVLVAVQHECSAAPCVITHIHVPSVVVDKEALNWENALLRFYIDGEDQASLNMTLLELGMVSYASCT